MKAKITCVYDEGALPNTHLIGAIGMSIMIDADGKRFLFGLGHRPRYLENNMGELGIESDSVDAVVVSHNHMDHRGALDGFMRERTKPIDFYAPASCFAEERKRFGRTDGMYPPEGKEGLMYRNDVAGWTDLSEHVHISPPMTQNGADECFLVVSTKVGPVLIVGCCHMGLDHAVDAVKERFGRIPAAVIGGLHIGKKNDRLADVYAGYLKDLGIKRLYLNHCTNERGIDRMRVTLGIDGVKDARQYTIPVEASLEAVRSGAQPELTTRQMHTRECFVVLEDGADPARIEREIKEMPNYFSDYDTTVHFISQEELDANHRSMAHGGFVFRSGTTAGGANSHVIEYSLKLDSNPEFTTSVLVAYARAAYRLNQAGDNGGKTVFDIAPALLCEQSGEDLRAHLL